MLSNFKFSSTMESVKIVVHKKLALNKLDLCCLV